MTGSRALRALVLLIVAGSACGKRDAPTAPPPTPTPAVLTMVSQPPQGVVGSPLADPIRVAVSDSRGVAMSGVTVTWTPAAGSVASTTSQTDAKGFAETRWTLGTAAGNQLLTAMIPGASHIAPVQLQAAAVAGPPTGIVIQPQDVSLQPLDAVVLVAEVAPDRYGNPVTTPLVWSSSDQVSAPITSGGRVVAGRAGRSVVSATVGAVTAQTTVTVAALWRSIDAGRSHSCALDELGYAFCWGENRLGQLGVGGIAYDSVPTPVSGARRFASLTVGWNHACGLTSAGVAYCWGNNSSGQLGTGSLTTEVVRTPTAVAGSHTFASIVSNGVHTCGVDMEGTAWCWGWEGEGQLGNGRSLTFLGQPSPVLVLGGRTWQSIAGGGSHTCATDAGTPYCWGNNHEGQVGDGSGIGYLTTPVVVAGALRMSRMATGGAHSCAIDVLGRSWCWGQNWMGQIGDGSYTTRYTPVEVASAVAFATLTAGGRHSCALDAEGQAYCWGYNETGQLGDGTTLRKASPMTVSTTARFMAISAGDTHNCAITSEGRAYCWGDNHIGQLGDGTFGYRTTPVPVAAP